MNSVHKKINEELPFLNLLTGTEAMSKGSIIVDKVGHALYRTILKQSTIQQANQNNLFTAGETAEGLFNSPREKIVRILARLVEEKLACQIFRLDYIEGELKLIPCYLAQSPVDAPISIYQAALRICVANIKAMIDAMPLVQRDHVDQILKADIEGQKFNLQLYPGFIINPFIAIVASAFDLPPHPRLVSASISILRKELIDNKILSPIPKYGFMPIRNEETVDRFLAAEHVLKNIITEKYSKDNAVIKNICNEIDLKYSIYQMDTFNPYTTKFTQELAKGLKKELGKKAKADTYHGHFTIESILSFGEKAEQLIQEQVKQENIQEYKRLRNQLFENTSQLEKLLMFMDEEEQNATHPEVLGLMDKDSSLACVRWELKKKSILLFMRKDQGVFIDVVRKLEKYKSLPIWQVLAFRSLIDKYDEEIKSIFDNPDFLEPYGRILRRVYTNYIPWYHRLLWYLNIEWFIDYCFQKAKLAVQEEQTYVRSENQAIHEMKKKQTNDVKKSTLKKIGDLFLLNEILSLMDTFYFEKKYVPTIQDLQSSMRDKGVSDIAECIRKKKFQIVSPPQVGLGWEKSIVLHPKDSSWATKQLQVKKVVKEVLKTRNKDHLSEDAYKRFQCVYDFLQRAAFSNKNTKLISDGQASAEITDSVKYKELDKQRQNNFSKLKKNEDPYKLFGHALERHKKHEEINAIADVDSLEL